LLSRSYRSIVPAVVLATAVVTASTVLPASAATKKTPPDPAGQHSVRGGVSDQNFYFVMADRFNNGTKANDDGGSPFPELVTRAWVKELKHRRRLMEG